MRQAEATRRPLFGQSVGQVEVDLTAWQEFISRDTPKQIIETSRESWESFDFNRHPDLQAAKTTIARFYTQHLERGGALILAGNSGCGKTRLARALRDMYGAVRVCYLNEVEITRELQDGFNKKREVTRTLDDIAAQAWRADWLIFDDLGAYPTENLNWVQGIYYSLFDYRLEAKKGVVVTTNLPLSIPTRQNEISYPLSDRLGQRCSSRLLGQVKEFTGDWSYYVNLFKVPDFRVRAR